MVADSDELDTVRVMLEEASPAGMGGRRARKAPAASTVAGTRSVAPEGKARSTVTRSPGAPVPYTVAGITPPCCSTMWLEKRGLSVKAAAEARRLRKRIGGGLAVETAHAEHPNHHHTSGIRFAASRRASKIRVASSP